MTLLLDTHVFLWFISADQRLSESMRDAIRDPSNDVFLSVVSLWETIIKHQTGKISLPQPPGLYLPAARMRHNIASLPLDEGSVARLTPLPLLHRDPFDRVLVCQALEHGLTLLTEDEAIRQYPVHLFGQT